jgi:hypothetical protein
MPNGFEFEKLFRRSERKVFAGRPLQFTNRGIWLPTPTDIVRSLAAAARSKDILPVKDGSPSLNVLDAGMGDGRLVVAMASSLSDSHAFGIESDVLLYTQANENLEQWLELEPSSRGRVRVVLGSYFDLAAYEELGLSVSDVDVFINYPDGNEDKLASFLAANARSGARLWLLSADRSLRLGSSELRHVQSVELEREGAAPPWLLLDFEV